MAIDIAQQAATSPRAADASANGIAKTLPRTALVVRIVRPYCGAVRSEPQSAATIARVAFHAFCSKRGLDERNLSSIMADVKARISDFDENHPPMISQTAEYALRAIVYLANQDAPRTTIEIAASTHVPAGYLAKLMQNLSRAGLVKSQRGLNGGYTLAHDPSELSILAVVEAVDPIQRFAVCPLGLPEHGPRLCPLHHRLNQAAAMVEQAFGETMVAELLTTPTKRGAPCRFPAEANDAR